MCLMIESVIMNLSCSKTLVVVLRNLRDQREKKRKHMTVSSFNSEHVREHRESLHIVKVITVFLVINDFF